MLTKLYIDNFRCFVNFEYRSARKQLIVGRNGSGKSSLLDALLFVRQFVARGDVGDFPMLSYPTRWMNQPQQTCEFEVALESGSYLYRLIVEPWGEPSRPRVASETVRLNGKPIFEFIGGEVHLFNDQFEHKVTYPFDWHRSALATIMSRKDNVLLTQFRRWLGGLLCFRIDPFVMTLRAEKDEPAPNVNLSNFAGWYRHLVQVSPRENAALLESLREAIDGFSQLRFERVGENISLLIAEFVKNGSTLAFGFNELSEGQRCLICLYAILHFVAGKGSTIVIDEPENFLSLREIQPWLMAVSDAIEERQGQILIISHHPEFINQWAPSCGVQFVREGLGPVRVEEFRGNPSSSLSPAELVARGWEQE